MEKACCKTLAFFHQKFYFIMIHVFQFLIQVQIRKFEIVRCGESKNEYFLCHLCCESGLTESGFNQDPDTDLMNKIWSNLQLNQKILTKKC